MLLLSLFVLCASWFIWCVVAFVKNLQSAKKVGFPIVISLISGDNPLWMVFGRLASPLLSKLPRRIGELGYYNTLNWSYLDQGRVHERLGPIIMHVSPGTNELLVADAASCDYILSRRKEFIKPISLLASINLFGKSLPSVEGAEWQRHRRITAPPFNERNSALVWHESWRQADQMLDAWTENRRSPVVSVNRDSARLALNIMTFAGFGQSYQFNSDGDNVQNGHSMSYGASLMNVMSNITLLVLVPSWVFHLPILPKAMASFRTASREFKRYMVDMVDLAKQEATNGEASHPNLLNTLVQKSETVKSSSVAGEGLTDDEIYGNLFIFSFAGHETTANTLAYSIYLLAAFPKWQDWIAEEVRSVCGVDDNLDISAYQELYPKLNRCLSTMQETLRLFPPVLKIPKSTGNSSQQIIFEGRQFTIPAHTHVFPSIVGLHSRPKYWGADADVWRPDRWIEYSSATSTSLKDETVKIPVKGSYIPWAEGPRICPGKKFSQVEYVAVIARLLRNHTIDVVKNSDESKEQACERVLSVIRDSDVKITLQMRNPESTKLRFVRRGA